MDDTCILQGMERVACFIDDILITGMDDEDHLRRLQEVLERLRQHGIVVKKKKNTHFFGESVKYLGHRVDKHGLHTVPEKVRAIVEAPHPKTAQELTSFFGLLNYYSKFIPNLASLIHPLNKLLKHGVKWELSESCVTAIEMAKVHV